MGERLREDMGREGPAGAAIASAAPTGVGVAVRELAHIQPDNRMEPPSLTGTAAAKGPGRGAEGLRAPPGPPARDSLRADSGRRGRGCRAGGLIPWFQGEGKDAKKHITGGR